MDHFVGGGGKERRLKNGRHPGGVFTQLGDRALQFCLYNEDTEQDIPLGEGGVPQHLISPTRD